MWAQSELEDRPADLHAHICLYEGYTQAGHILRTDRAPFCKTAPFRWDESRPIFDRCVPVKNALYKE